MCRNFALVTYSDRNIIISSLISLKSLIVAEIWRRLKRFLSAKWRETLLTWEIVFTQVLAASILKSMLYHVYQYTCSSLICTSTVQYSGVESGTFGDGAGPGPGDRRAAGFGSAIDDLGFTSVFSGCSCLPKITQLHFCFTLWVSIVLVWTTGGQQIQTRTRTKRKLQQGLCAGK